MITPSEHRPELAAALGVSDLFLKREDLHPYGSHKGRSIPVMIDRYYAQGDRRFAISSSGNAALAAALHGATLPDIELDIYVGQHIGQRKLDKLMAAVSGHQNIRVLRKERPLQALAQAIEEGARSLRQSTDDAALLGYESLAEEIAAIPGPAGAVFIGASSGTTAQALADYFISHKLPIQVHIVQTSACHPLFDAFETFDGAEEVSLADAIVDRTALRKPALIPRIEKTGGRGWCAENSEIRAAQELARTHAQLDISPNSALSLVGAMHAAYLGYDLGGPAVCILGGD